MVDVTHCFSCELRQKCGYIPFSGKGNNNAAIMAVLVKPNTDSALISECSGREYDFLNKVLKEVDVTDYYVTHLIKCAVSKTDIDERHISICKKWLWHEIQLVKPSLIFTFGQLPMRVLLKQKKSVKLQDFVGVAHQLDYSDAKLHCFQSLDYIINRGKNTVNQFREQLKNAVAT